KGRSKALAQVRGQSRPRLGGEALGTAGRNPRAKGLDQPAYLVDEKRPGPHEPITRSEQEQIRLGPSAPVLDRTEELRVDSRQPSEGVGIGSIALARTVGDPTQLAGVRHDHFLH